MARITWHPDALVDIDKISEYIASDSLRHGKEFAKRVFSATERLSRYPRSGRVVPELQRPEIREIIVGDYRVIYRLLVAEIEIQYVTHGARLLKPTDIAERSKR